MNIDVIKNEYYVVTMYRYANKEAHSYLLGVFTDKDKAIEAGESHAIYRGGKYESEILEIDLNYAYYENGIQKPKIIIALKG